MITSILLCFIHGFKGDEDTFYSFPEHLKEAINKTAPQLTPECLVYPKYETMGDLPACVGNFREWLIRQVMVREKAAGNARPQSDPTVGVFLIAHSMGGLVATDTLLSIMDDGAAPKDTSPRQIFPAIQGVLTFDTPFAGLSRSMFAYGAFAQYRTISSAYGLVSSVSALPAQMIGRAGTSTATSAANASAAATDAVTDGPAWKLWQTVAMRTGAAGAIAAAGAAAYMNRENLGKGLSYMNKDDISRGLSSMNLENIKQALSMINKDQLQQGFAYMSRENIGQGFAWLSSHLQFVSALMRRQELQTRIDRMSAMEGIGFADQYTSLGPNDKWSGGYFVAERTFCAVPAPNYKANKFFLKEINPKAKDEIEAHLSMLSDQKNPGYDEMSTHATGLVLNWAKSHHGQLVDHYRLNNPDKPTFNKYTYSTESGLQEMDEAKQKAAKKKTKGAQKPKATTDKTEPAPQEQKAAHAKYTYGTSGFQELTADGKLAIPTSQEASRATTPISDPKVSEMPDDPIAQAGPAEEDGLDLSTTADDPIAQAGPPEEEDLDLENVPGVTDDLEIEKDEGYVESAEDGMLGNQEGRQGLEQDATGVSEKDPAEQSEGGSSAV